MQDALKDKSDQVQRMKDLEKEENEKYLKFIKDKDQQAQQIK